MKLKKNRLGSLYKKPKDKRRILQVLTVAVVSVVTILLTAAYGNFLKKRAAELPTDTTPTLPSATTQTEPNPIEKERGDLASLPLPKAAFSDKDSFCAALDTLQDCEAVTLQLRTADAVRWNSETAKAVFGIQTDGILTGQELLSEVKSRGKYASVIFETLAFSRADSTSTVAAAEKAAIRSYEQLLIAELYEAGADEIVLTGIPLSDALLPSLTDYCAELRAFCPDITLGLCVPSGTGSTDTGLALLARVDGLFDVLCLDLSAALTADLESSAAPLPVPMVAGDETAAALPEFPSLKEACLDELLFISRFGMSVLLRIPDTVSPEACSKLLLPFLAELSIRSVSLLYE